MRTTLSAYSGKNLLVLGKCKLQRIVNSKQQLLHFFVVNTDKKLLLGLLLMVALNLIQRVDSIETNVSNYSKLISANKELFAGIGCMNKPYKIEWKTNAIPVVRTMRKLPKNIRDKSKEHLITLQKQNIIGKVEDTTDWVSALVIVRKPNGSLRICLDPKDINEAIKLEYFQIPTLQQITKKLTGA